MGATHQRFWYEDVKKGETLLLQSAMYHTLLVQYNICEMIYVILLNCI
jgi:hypothetical protein